MEGTSSVCRSISCNMLDCETGRIKFSSQLYARLSTDDNILFRKGRSSAQWFSFLSCSMSYMRLSCICCTQNIFLIHYTKIHFCLLMAKGFSLKQYLNSFYRNSLDKKWDVATSYKDLMISPLLYIKLHEHVFMHYIWKKIFLVLHNLDRFSNLNLNIWPLIWKKYTFASWSEKVVILGEYLQVYFLTCTSRAMPWNLTQLKILQSYLFLAVPNIIYTAFSLPGDLQGMIWPCRIWISPFLSLFVIYPSNTAQYTDTTCQTGS